MKDIGLLKYVGRKYEEYNCLDLAKEFYRDVFDLDLRNYYEGDTPGRQDVASLIETNKGDFYPVTGARQLGDLLVIRIHGFECHLGVVIDRSRFLHSIKNTGSCIDRIERYHGLIAGTYRHKEVV